MTSQTFDRSERTRAMWLGTLALTVMTIGGAIARRAAGADAAMAVAWIYELGTLAVAAVTMRVAGYPRWAWIATAGVLSLALVIGAITAQGPRELKNWMASPWMMPWLLLVMALSPVSSKLCAMRSPWSGFWLIGTSIVFSSILLGVNFLPNR